MPAPLIGPSSPLFIVLNAGAGSADAAATRRIVEEGCAAAGRRHRIFVVDERATVQALAREAVERARAVGGVVVAAGGDGTVNAVAQATLGSGLAFGVLPQGTFNYFSRTHGIPVGTAEALEVLLTEQPRPAQVGLVNDRAFLVNASMGLYAELLEDRESYKARYGRSRWIAFFAGLSP
jgi:diacylglycerol kinase family enzyme